MLDQYANLPWQIQVSLASGYAGYLLAYMGIRSGHSAVDTAFITLIFGLLATGTLALFGYANLDVSKAPYSVVSGAIAFLVTCGIALLWRRWLRGWLRALLRAWKITYSDDDPSALATLSGNTKHLVSQIGVELDNGTWLRCDDAAKFRDAPYGPFVIGPNGDVALYLTHEEPHGAPEKELKTVRLAGWGDRITYVPASRIRQIIIRHKH